MKLDDSKQRRIKGYLKLSYREKKRNEKDFEINNENTCDREKMLDLRRKDRIKSNEEKRKNDEEKKKNMKDLSKR